MDKLKMGADELEILKHMFERWLKRDIEWAVEYIHTHGVSGDEDEWEFLFKEWKEKFYQWIEPYINRLRETEYITHEDAAAYTMWAFSTMDIMLQVLYKLGETIDGRK